jgi:hypothetical protein
MEFVFEDKIINCMDEDILLDTFKDMYNKQKYVQCVLYIEKKLSAFSNKFYDVMILYLNSLIASNDKEKALKLVKEELAMPYIPGDYEEKFKEIYRELSYKEKESKDFTLSIDQIKNILETYDDAIYEDKLSIIRAIIEMSKLNIREFIDSIEVFFKRNLRNTYKVMVVDALRSQGVNWNFDFVNGDESTNINPLTSENVLESEVYSNIKSLLEETIGKQNPNLLSLATENLMLYLSEIYPKTVKSKEYNFIAYCVHTYSARMYGLEVSEDELALIYKIDKNNKEKMFMKLETACSI